MLSTEKEREVRKLLKSLPEHSSIGTDMLDSKVFSLAADYVFPTIWKEGKIIPLPKDGRLALTEEQ